MLLPLLTAFATILGCAMMLRFTQWFKRWVVLSRIPSPPASSLLLGHIPDVMTDQAPLVVAEWCKQLGPVIRIRFLHQWVVCVADTRRAQQVLQKAATYCPKYRAPYKPLELASDPPRANVLTSEDGEYWRAMRGAWMKCFTSVQLKQLYPTILQVCERAHTHVVEAGAGRAPLDMAHLAECITLDVIGFFNYNVDLGATQSKCSRFLELMRGMLALMHHESNHPLVVALRGRSQEQVLLRAEWNDINMQLVAEAMAHPPPDTTIAGQLLKVTDPTSGAPLTQAQLCSELVLATLAGFETTSNALTYTAGMLATHPQALGRLEQELSAAGLLQQPGGPPPRSFAWSDLGRLPYLSAVIREGLRLFSPAAMGSVRRADKDVALDGGYVVPKGTMIIVPFYCIGRDAATYGPDAEAFTPERWLNPEQLHKVLQREPCAQQQQQQGEQQQGEQERSSERAAAAGVGGVVVESVDTEEQVQYLTGADTQAAATAAAGHSTSPISDTTSSNGHSSNAQTAAAAAGPAPSKGGGGSSSSSARLPDPLSFSLGARDCAGQALARIELQVRGIELQVVLALLMGRFHLELAPEVGGLEGLLQRRMYHLTLQVRDGLPMIFTPRA